MGKNRKSVSANVDGPLNPELDVKNAIRSRKLTMLKTVINAIKSLNDDDPDSTICALRSDLDFRWSDYMHAFEEQEAILAAVGDESLHVLCAEFAGMHNSYLKAKMHAGDILSGPTEAERPPQNNTMNTNENRPAFKMAPMRISPFSGESADWIEFKATCDTILIAKFPEVQRLQYLKDALFGEARALVSHILPGEGAFDRAMQLLKDRYDNQRAIINAHLKRLYAIPSIDTPTAEIFRSTLNVVNGLVSALNGFGIDTTSWDSILIYHISQRFDKTTLTQWEDKLDGKRFIPKLRVLIDFLQVRITISQTTETFDDVQQSEKWDKRSKPAPAHKLHGDNKKSPVNSRVFSH